MFSFGHCPNYLSPAPSPSFGQLVPLFWMSKTMFCAYDRKNTNDDNDGCNDNYDGNFDDNYDKNYQITCKYQELCNFFMGGLLLPWSELSTSSPWPPTTSIAKNIIIMVFTISIIIITSIYCDLPAWSMTRPAWEPFQSQSFQTTPQDSWKGEGSHCLKHCKNCETALVKDCIVENVFCR